MRKIISYAAVNGLNMATIVDQVNESIEKGWQPYGNPFIYYKGDLICQPLVKYEEDK